MAIGVCITFQDFRQCALFRSHKLTRSPLYTDNAKPQKDPSILRTERELRQQGARRRDRDLSADCLERRRGNQLRGEKRGNRKSGRAVAKPRHPSTISSKANVLKVCRPDAHTPSPQKLSRKRR
eukprot:6201334-Pleurochrysis_carterae.AAC.1